MAYDLYDFFAGAMGRPDPRQQLYNSLGQGPGQAGSAQGPQPLAAGNGAPSQGGGPPGAAPGAAAAPAGPQVYQSPPDLAQAYVALSGGGQANAPPANAPPPDLAQMFMAYQQREQAKQDFWGGLAGVAQALHPGRVTPGMVKSITGTGEDAGSLFNNLFQINQWQQQQQALQAYQAGIPKMLADAGLSQDYAPLLRTNPSLLGDILKNQMGLTGTQIDKEYKQQVKQFQDANPGQPLPPDLQSEGAWDQAQREAITTRDTAAKTKTADLIADQHNFNPALQNYDKAIGYLDEFMQPDMQKAASEFLGRGGQFKGDIGALSPNGRKAWGLYKNIMGSQYSASTQDFKGAGRITNQMLTQDSPSQSTMSTLNQEPGDFFVNAAKYREQLAGHRALLFGAAQRANDPRLSDEDYAKYVHPSMDIYGGKGRDIPDFSKMSADDADKAYEALPSGQNKVFIDTDGQPKRKP